jgi:hypothetical protein
LLEFLREVNLSKRDRIEGICEKIRKNTYFIDQKNWGNDRRKELKREEVTLRISRENAERVIRHCLKSMSDVEPKTVDPQSPVANVLAPMFTQSSSKYFEMVSTTTYGLLEVKIALEGELLILGIPLELLMGESTGSKMQYLSTWTYDDLLAAIKKDNQGFCVKLTKNVGIVLPPRFALVMCAYGEHVFEGIKYQLPGNTSCKRESVLILDDLLACYKNLKGTTHEVLRNHLKVELAKEKEIEEENILKNPFDAVCVSPSNASSSSAAMPTPCPRVLRSYTKR